MSPRRGTAPNTEQESRGVGFEFATSDLPGVVDVKDAVSFVDNGFRLFQTLY
jgi:hypothetical protein